MPNKRIDQLPASTNQIQGTDLIPTWSDNKTERITIDALTSYIGSENKTYTEVTYTEITNLISSSGLTEGSFYLITDFQTIYDQPDFDAGGLPKPSNQIQTKTGTTTPIFVMSTSVNTLAPDAYQPAYPNDKLKYDVTWNQTEVTNTPAKGRITERIDELNNRTDYDHREVLFKRYEVVSGSGQFATHRDTGFASQEFKTFAWDFEIIDNGAIFSSNNYIGDSAIYNTIYFDTFILANNVFGPYSEKNNFGTYCRNNTFLEACYLNYVKGEFYSNEVYRSFRQNHIDEFFYENEITEIFRENNIGLRFRQNVIKAHFHSNHIGNFFSNNNIESIFFGLYFNDNIIKSSFTNNIITNSFILNTTNASISGEDFSLATHVYGNYSCELTQRQDGAKRLKYIDNTDALRVTNITS